MEGASFQRLPHQNAQPSRYPSFFTNSKPPNHQGSSSKRSAEIKKQQYFFGNEQPYTLHRNLSTITFGQLFSFKIVLAPGLLQTSNLDYKQHL